MNIDIKHQGLKRGFAITLLAMTAATPMLGLAQHHSAAPQAREGMERPPGFEQGARNRAAPPEAFRAPTHYRPVAPPSGWNNRPRDLDRDYFNHNFRAHRSYAIGPYLRPPGWVEREWFFGDVLPAAFWAPEYQIADYWLFDLDTPPVGYEWVRYGHEALLVNLTTGAIEQVVRGLFT